MPEKRPNRFWKSINWLFSLAVISGIGWGVWQYTSKLDAFKITQVILRGNSIVSDDEIQSMLNLSRDSSLLALSVKDLQNRLASLDYVDLVRISRQLPGTLVIDVKERQLLAVISTPEGKWILDQQGLVLPYHPAVEKLPVLKGDLSRITPGLLKDDQLLDYYSFLHTLALNYPEIYNHCEEMQVRESNILLLLEPDQVQIRFPRQNAQTRLPVLLAFVETVQPIRHLSDYRYIDLRYDGQVVVKENRNRSS